MGLSLKRLPKHLIHLSPPFAALSLFLLSLSLSADLLHYYTTIQYSGVSSLSNLFLSFVEEEAKIGRRLGWRQRKNGRKEGREGSSLVAFFSQERRDSPPLS